MIYFYVICVFYASGGGRFLELGPSVQPSDIAVLQQIHTTLSVVICQGQRTLIYKNNPEI